MNLLLREELLYRKLHSSLYLTNNNGGSIQTQSYSDLAQNMTGLIQQVSKWHIFLQFLIWWIWQSWHFFTLLNEKKYFWNVAQSS